MSETRILIRLLRIFHGTGNSARLCQNFGIWGGFEPQPPSPTLGTPLPSADLANIGRNMPRTLQMYLSTTLHTSTWTVLAQSFHYVSSHFSIVITREFYAGAQSTVLQTRPLRAENMSNENNSTALEKMASALIDISTVDVKSCELFFQQLLS
jgi:hypothetical protein